LELKKERAVTCTAAAKRRDAHYHRGFTKIEKIAQKFRNSIVAL
jgi:hypothetical protein